MDAIAQEVTSNRKLPNGNAPDSSKVDHSEFEGMYICSLNKGVSIG